MCSARETAQPVGMVGWCLAATADPVGVWTRLKQSILSYRVVVVISCMCGAANEYMRPTNGVGGIDVMPVEVVLMYGMWCMN
jgi:hypothetical protein